MLEGGICTPGLLELSYHVNQFACIWWMENLNTQKFHIFRWVSTIFPFVLGMLAWSEALGVDSKKYPSLNYCLSIYLFHNKQLRLYEDSKHVKPHYVLKIKRILIKKKIGKILI